MKVFILFLAVFINCISISICELITDYKCATSDGCNESCVKMNQFIIDNNSRGWAVRHSSLGSVYHSHGCEISAEIGMAFGGLTRHFLSTIQSIKEYHAIDPFMGGYDNSDAMSNFLKDVNEKHGNGSEIWRDAILYNLKDYGCRFKMHYGLSAAVSHHFANNSIDCIFIDGDHTYEGVKQDLINYYYKVKPGGLILFDDYSFPFPGVVRAVDHFIDNNHLQLVKINKHNNYYVVKPDKPLEFLWQYEPK